MKVFISHKYEDSITANQILEKLKELKVDAYLDLLDTNLLFEGEKLTKHIKDRLNECTDLMAVVSNNTQSSWWVPFEIGMAAQQDFPIVNYLKDGVTLPDYLSYWPKLKSLNDISKYVEAKQYVQKQILNEALSKSHYSLKGTPTSRFYQELKSRL
ncbi:MAG TPA: cytosolic protein [Clostridiales bacterium]|nr:cytosolic protein [Clostridiales bacterium]